MLRAFPSQSVGSAQPKEHKPPEMLLNAAFSAITTKQGGLTSSDCCRNHVPTLLVDRDVAQGCDTRMWHKDVAQGLAQGRVLPHLQQVQQEPRSV